MNTEPEIETTQNGSFMRSLTRTAPWLSKSFVKIKTTKARFGGHEFFGAMMNHFDDNVRIIVGHWLDVPGFDSNLKLFNEKTKQGTSKTEAAFYTKTGTWAKQWGFARIESLETTPDDFPGGYEQVLVEFGK